MDLNRAVDDALRILYNQYKNLPVEIVKDYGDVPAVEGNFANLGQVLLNIIRNALQALPDGNGQISLTTRYLAETDTVVFECRDTGMGIPAASLKDIFKPFFTTKTVGRGTGLGLYISHEIIRRHDGQIRVASEEGRGTVVTVELPCRRRERMNGLMVVDDEEGVRRSLKKVLERDGYRIILAENGEEALYIVRSDGRDIETVISDYRMPGMDGLETLIEIGRLNAEITRIMLTGYATMASAIEAVNEGIDGFLTKPFENDELRAKVREYNIKKRLKQFVSEQVLAELQKNGKSILPKRLNGEHPVQRHPRIFRPFRAAQSR